MADLQELEKKISSKKTSSALTDSLSRRAWFKEMWKSVGRLMWWWSSSGSNKSKWQITRDDEENEQKLIDARSN